MGTDRLKVERYHRMPGWSTVIVVAAVQSLSGMPGRYHPARSPYRPPLLYIVRAVSPVCSVLSAPRTRHVTAPFAGRLAELRPRGWRDSPLSDQSRFWPRLWTTTERTTGSPALIEEGSSMLVVFPTAR